MTEKLNLTSAQQAQIKPLLQNEAQQMKAIHSDKSLSADQKKAQFRALAESTHQQIKPLLSKDQQTKLAQFHHKKQSSQGSSSTGTSSTAPAAPAPAAPTP